MDDTVTDKEFSKYMRLERKLFKVFNWANAMKPDNVGLW
jgi:hypothetical protein